MAKTKQKPEAKPNQVEIGLSNVFTFIVQMLGKFDRDIDRLQKTVDAIGLLLSEYGLPPKPKAKKRAR